MTLRPLVGGWLISNNGGMIDVGSAAKIEGIAITYNDKITMAPAVDKGAILIRIL